MGNPNLEFSTGKILLLDKYRFLDPGHLRELYSFFRMISEIFVPVGIIRIPSLV